MQAPVMTKALADGSKLPPYMNPSNKTLRGTISCQPSVDIHIK